MNWPHWPLFRRSLALMLLLLSQQSLALFDIKEWRSATGADCIDAPGHNDLLLEDATEFHRRRCGHSLVEEAKKNFPGSGKSVMVSAAIGLLNRMLLLV